MADTRTLETPPMTVVERARAYFAGKLDIPPLKLSEEAAVGLEASLQETGVEATSRVKQDFTNTLALQEHYAGRGPVLYATAPEGAVVLAVGYQEVMELQIGLTDDEAARIQIDYPVDPATLRP